MSLINMLLWYKLETVDWSTAGEIMDKVRQLGHMLTKAHSHGKLPCHLKSLAVQQWTHVALTHGCSLNEIRRVGDWECGAPCALHHPRGVRECAQGRSSEQVSGRPPKEHQQRSKQQSQQLPIALAWHDLDPRHRHGPLDSNHGPQACRCLVARFLRLLPRPLR